MDQLLSSHPNSLFLICGDFNCHHASWLAVGTSLTCHGTSAKAFCDSLGLTQSVNFPTRISTNGTLSLLDLILTNFPENVCCSSSAPFCSSYHMLVKMDISLDVLREPPQRCQVWHFTQADWQRPQAAIKLLDWSPITTSSDINSPWEFFQRNLHTLSCTDLSPLVFSCPTHPPALGLLKLVARQLS